MIDESLNEYGLYDNAVLDGYILNFNEKGLLNLARFLYYNANDGAFDDMDEAVSEVYNIMRGEYHINWSEEE